MSVPRWLIAAAVGGFLVLAVVAYAVKDTHSPSRDTFQTRPLGQTVRGETSAASHHDAPCVVAKRSAESTKGTVPSRPDGHLVDRSHWPDFVAVFTYGRGGVSAGYTPKEYALGACDAGRKPEPVYGENLKTLVGHMYNGRGFVPLGSDPHSYPSAVATSTSSTTSAP